MGVTLGDRQLNRIFPFHLEIDAQFCIVSQGKSLIKMIDDVRSQSFLDVFKNTAPIENETIKGILSKGIEK